MENFLPKEDAKFAEWLAHFNAAIAENLDHLDMMPADIAPTIHAETEMATALATIRQAEETLREAKKSLQTAHRNGEKAARSLLSRIADHAKLPTNVRRKLSLPVAKTPRQRAKNRPLLPAPPAPGGLSANIEADGSHWLRWNANGNPPGTKYLLEAAFGPGLERKRGGMGQSLPVQPTHWTQVAVTQSLEITCRLSQASEPVVYRLRARNDQGESGYSEQLYVTPKKEPTFPHWHSRMRGMLARHAPAPAFAWRAKLVHSVID
jgi:hypothetical protein